MQLDWKKEQSPDARQGDQSMTPVTIIYRHNYLSRNVATCNPQSPVWYGLKWGFFSPHVLPGHCCLTVSLTGKKTNMLTRPWNREGGDMYQKAARDAIYSLPNLGELKDCINSQARSSSWCEGSWSYTQSKPFHLPSLPIRGTDGGHQQNLCPNWCT